MRKILPLIFFVSVLFCSSNSKKAEYLLPEEYQRSTKDLEVVFLDVGQGDCIFIKTPKGKTLLVDAGGAPYWAGDSAFDPGEEIVVPYLKGRGIDSLDYVIVTHPHGDHFGGMFAVLNKIKVKNFIDNGYAEGDPNYKDLLTVVDKKEIPYDQLKETDKFEVDKDIRITVFFPPPKGFPFEGANNSSIVFKLEYKKFSVLFCADAETEVEDYISNRYKNILESNVIKVPHHGSRTSSSMRFLKLVKPEVGIIMSGKRNMFGHPHSEVVNRYQKLKVDLYNTAVDGTVVIFSDGEKYTIETSVDK